MENADGDKDKIDPKNLNRPVPDHGSAVIGRIHGRMLRAITLENAGRMAVSAMPVAFMTDERGFLGLCAELSSGWVQFKFRLLIQQKENLWVIS